MSATRRTTLWLPVLILLLAAFARLWHFSAAPPGLQHDELFYAQDGRSIIEDGNWRIFYPNNQGREGGYIWFLALAYLMFGASTVMVKIPALWISLLTLAMLYRFTRDVFSYRAAVIALGLGAVTFWPIFIGRVGLRAATLPLVGLVVLWGVWRVCYRKMPVQNWWQRWRAALLTGIVLGFAAYTYTAWFALYAAYAAFIPGLALFDRVRFRPRWRDLAIIGVIALVLALPMIRLYFDGTITQARVNTISKPWTDFRAGHPELLFNNARLLAAMPFYTGDPEWRYNIAGRPFFATPLGLFVYVGLLIVLWQMRRKPINTMLLALTFAGLIPSLLTTSAPSFLRVIIIFPALLMYVAVAIDAISRLGKSVNWSRIAWTVGIFGVLVTAAVDWPAYFNVWVRNDEVRSIYREDLRLLGNYLREQNEPLALVSTNAPADYLDPLLYRYSNPQGNHTNIVWFDGHVDIALSEKPSLLFVSPLAKITDPQKDWLTQANGTETLSPLLAPDGKLLFDVYRISATGTVLQDRVKQASQWPISLITPQSFSSTDISQWSVPLAFPINFGNLLQLRGVYVPQGKPLPQYANLTDWPGINMQLYLQPLVEHYPTPINIFVHVLSADGRTIVGQRDFMGVPATSWNKAITFMQDHYTGFPENVIGKYYVTLGAYNVQTGERLPILDANGKAIGDRILLAAVENTAK
ncbi:MAG: glycosyltransferase family 39 protein [Chloroflexota bacterium]